MHRPLQRETGLAIACALAAALCYGIASIYVKKASAVDAFSNAHGSMWAAALLITPIVPFFNAPAVPAAEVIGTVIALGVLWGVLFLGETIGWHTIAGSAEVLAGTVLATGYSFGAAFAGWTAGRD